MSSVPYLCQSVSALCKVYAWRITTLLAPPSLLPLELHLFCIIVLVYLLATARALHQMVLSAALAEPIAGDVSVHRCRSQDCGHFPTLLTRLRLLRTVSVAVPHGHVLDVVLAVLQALLRAEFVAVSAHTWRIPAFFAQVTAVFIARVRWWV